MNKLIWSDADGALRSFEGSAVDLVYMDPPFATGRTFYAGKKKAFDDSFAWTVDMEERLHAQSVSQSQEARALRGMWLILGPCRLMAYLIMMAPVVSEARRVLRDSGSLVLHCDPTTSHYLKILLDSVFGTGGFRNEVIWHYRRWPTKARQFQKMHDVMLFYSKSCDGAQKFHVLYGYEPLAASTLKTFGTKKQRADFSSGHRKPSVVEEETIGPPLSDVWEVGVIAPSAKERCGYPTQKPIALLERVVLATTDPGDLVVDPFCGSGTTLLAAHKHGRRFVGCDIGDEAIEATKRRLAASNVPYEMPCAP